MRKLTTAHTYQALLNDIAELYTATRAGVVCADCFAALAMTDY